MPKDEVPVEIIFFQNGQTAVGNRNGEQIGKYQDRHEESIRLLAADGYDWRKLRVTGFPDSAFIDPLNPYTGEVSVMAIMKNIQKGHTGFPEGLGNTH